MQQNATVATAPPETTLGKLTAIPQTPIWFSEERGKFYSPASRSLEDKNGQNKRG